jgi:hypothetical protein
VAGAVFSAAFSDGLAVAEPDLAVVDLAAGFDADDLADALPGLVDAAFVPGAVMTFSAPGVGCDDHSHESVLRFQLVSSAAAP